MNKVSKKDKTFSSNKCNSVHKAAQDKTCTTTEDLCEDINSLRIKSKHVNGLINGSIVKDLTRENEPAKPTEKGKSKKGKKTTTEALTNHIDTGTIEVQPGCSSSSTSYPCTSTSLDSVHSKTEPQDCKCILNNENSIDEAYLSDFDISAFIQSRCEEKKLKSSSPECSLDKLATEKEKTTEERIADSTCSKTENESSGNNADTDPDSTPITNPVIDYVEYQSELQMPLIMKIIQKDLSEPYSIYTYRYFIHNWPNLCFLAMCGDQCVGAIVCKLDIHRAVIRRGYIAMLAVDRRYRKHGLGSTLVRRAIAQMVTGGADEVVLETEITNRPALRLYEALGFVRDKRLFRYYLNGVDALRLKLWLR